PASVTSASDSPFTSRCTRGSTRAASSKARSEWSGFWIPRCFSRFPEWRVSSATTASQEASTSRARSVMSARFPIGAATTNSGTLWPRIERVLEVRQRRSLGTVDHGDDVEPRRLGRSPPLRQVIPRRCDHAPLLALVDRLLRSAESAGGPRADLHEHQQLTLLRDQVDLPARAAVVARDDAIAAGAQQVRCRLLTERAELHPRAHGRTRTHFMSGLRARQAASADRYALRTRSALPVSAASATRWITCVCV